MNHTIDEINREIKIIAVMKNENTLNTSNKREKTKK